MTPKGEARYRAAVEKRQTAWRMRKEGKTFREIGERFGVSAQRAGQLSRWGEALANEGPWAWTPITFKLEKAGSDYSVISNKGKGRAFLWHWDVHEDDRALFDADRTGQEITLRVRLKTARELGLAG